MLNRHTIMSDRFKALSEAGKAMAAVRGTMTVVGAATKANALARPIQPTDRKYAQNLRDSSIAQIR